jgi:hypothetical protein
MSSSRHTIPTAGRSAASLDVTGTARMPVLRGGRSFRVLFTLALLVSSVAFGARRSASPRDERLEGFSGALRVTVAVPGEVVAYSGVPWDVRSSFHYRWVPELRAPRAKPTGFEPHDQGFRTPPRAGAWRLELRRGKEIAHTDLVILTTVSADRVRKGYLNGYHIGRYQLDRSMPPEYAPPSGFIEVTKQNQNLFVSDHFQLRQFLTKDQHQVWPKYLVLDLRLVDKLELVLRELNATYSPAKTLHVMSGYRTPQYNGRGGKGRARLSRHMYGDAADVWIDSDGDGRLDDLNGDGKYDVFDGEVLVSVVERVQQKYAELSGGAAAYESNHAHGPFVHVDARGRAARWAMRE